MTLYNDVASDAVKLYSWLTYVHISRSSRTAENSTPHAFVAEEPSMNMKNVASGTRDLWRIILQHITFKTSLSTAIDKG